MYLKHLSLTNFRNFARLDIDIPQGAVLLVGANAQGKTSLLEAIYYLASFVSFHADNDRQLINFLAAREPLAVTRIVAEYCHSEAHKAVSSHRLEVRVVLEGSGVNGGARLRKEVLVDGVKRKLNEAVGRFNAVLFLPQSLRVLEGSPEERRRYLNLTLSQVKPGYAAALSDYTHALAQRNALLKQLYERSGDTQQLSYWDGLLAASGAQLIHTRIQAVQELERHAAQVHSQLTRGLEVLRVAYDPAYDPLPKRAAQYAFAMDAPLDRSGISTEKIQAGFLDELARLRQEEIQRGVTTIGPHRDEMRFLGNGIDLGTYGSRGQARTAMLSLKLAEVSWIKEKTGQWPVLLLDEVLAELDLHRRNDLLARLTSCEQSLLTTTDLDLFDATFVSQAAVWQVTAGRLEIGAYDKP